MPKYVSVILIVLAFLSACATSPLGRRQLRLFPASEVNAMGVAAFAKLEKETPAAKSGKVNRYVRCVANAITAALPGKGGPGSWEVVVFQDDAVNAFALPGGKIGVYTGLLKVAQNQHQLATVLGHEVAHVLANHSNERVSTAYATQAGVQQMAKIFSGASAATQERALAVLGVGAQVGVALPFGRTQESEADIIGVDLMARAGFNPRQSIQLWKRMDEAGGARPPEFLSTHPSPQTRIEDLRKRLSSRRQRRRRYGNGQRDGHPGQRCAAEQRRCGHDR